MILLDLNQVIIANLMQYLNYNTKNKAQLDEGLIRHMCLNSLRSYIKQFSSKYGKMVVCCDSRTYWRKGVFPYYKSHRRKDRDASPIDWAFIFDNLSRVRDELKTVFPHKIIEVPGAEADDIIAVLAARYSPSDDILIISSDKDFVQLQKYPRVQQYSPFHKRFIKTEDPATFVKEHIIKGDQGDGIPNFLSADNTFAAGDRQKSINKKKLAEWLKEDPDEFCVNPTMKSGYARNKLLIDMDCIPESIKVNVVQTYNETKPGNMTAFLDYMLKHKMRNLIEVADEFRGY